MQSNLLIAAACLVAFFSTVGAALPYPKRGLFMKENRGDEDPKKLLKISGKKFCLIKNISTFASRLQNCPITGVGC